MDEPGNDVFSGAALAGDQDRNVGGGHFAQPRTNGLHNLRSEEHTSETPVTRSTPHFRSAWMSLAMMFFPVPLSPVIRTGTLAAAPLPSRERTDCITSDRKSTRLKLQSLAPRRISDLHG